MSILSVRVCEQSKFVGERLNSKSEDSPLRRVSRRTISAVAGTVLDLCPQQLMGNDVMKFYKYEGLGNDFILLDKIDINPQMARQLCDRRFGIGGDGVLCILPSHSAHARMKVYNADGTIAEMRQWLTMCRSIRAQDSPAGSRRVRCRNRCGRFKCPCHRPEYSNRNGSPLTDYGSKVINLENMDFAGRFLSAGNPHFVLFGNFTRTSIERVGPQLEQHPTFPNGANISFAQCQTRREVKLTVWERGCGLTLACGTGATATVVAGWRLGLLDVGQAVTVHLPGGALKISGEVSNPTMTGPARQSIRGPMAHQGVNPRLTEPPP